MVPIGACCGSPRLSCKPACPFASNASSSSKLLVSAKRVDARSRPCAPPPAAFAAAASAATARAASASAASSRALEMRPLATALFSKSGTAELFAACRLSFSPSDPGRPAFGTSWILRPTCRLVCNRLSFRRVASTTSAASRSSLLADCQSKLSGPHLSSPKLSVSHAGSAKPGSTMAATDVTRQSSALRLHCIGDFTEFVLGASGPEGTGATECKGCCTSASPFPMSQT
mmetsp:Transcript_69520/g.122948  ORF Transcript_69520/g.122948 Transcript_69520/m.122948 type:complete len:230 (+) Transcript_69520:747-1436(+)